MLTPTALQTRRLALLPLQVGDAKSMVEVLADDGMYEFTGGQPPTLAELRERYARLAVGQSADGSELWFNWIVCLIDGSVPVGAMQATVAPDGATADVAWQIGVRWQGRGLASEAAEEVVRWLTVQGVAVVRALIHPNHVASQLVAQRAGLRSTSDIEDGEVAWMRPAQ